MSMNLFTLTDAAVEKIAELGTLENAKDLHLRVAVRPGGCSGFSYEMFFDADIVPADTVFTVVAQGSQVRVAVDEASAPLLTGATLDYKDGLERAGFSFTNPNAVRSCGCGKSFS